MGFSQDILRDLDARRAKRCYSCCSTALHGSTLSQNLARGRLGVVSAVMGVAGWFGSLVGIRVVEKLNRDTLREAAERYANGLIDLAQARYLDANPGAIADLVAGGIDYIKTGNPGTVKQTRIKDDRVGAYVTEAIQKVSADRLSSALGRALTQGVAAVSGS